MTDFDLAATVTRLRRWQPPAGVSHRIVLAPDGETCRVTSCLSANDFSVVRVVFEGPPDPCQLAQLTGLAEAIIEDAKSLGPVAPLMEKIPRGICDPSRN